MKSYSEQLIFTDADDGVALDGVMMHPTDGAPNTAVIWIHGNTGQFYTMSYVLIGRALAEQGFLFISGNTRGHDVVAQNFNVKTMQMVAGGSAWERYEDAPLDISAWIDIATKERIDRIILAGHSQGAAKVVYTQAQRKDERVKGLILASPDLHGHWKADFVQAARDLVAKGQGDDGMPPLFNAPYYRLSAANVVSRAEVLSHVYTSDQDTPTIAQITCPILVMFGSDHDIGGEAEFTVLRQQAVRAPHVETRIVGGDHVYFGHEAEVAKVIEDWIEAVKVRSTET